MKFKLLLLLIICAAALNAQTYPKREFRGAWIATVMNIDWPSSQGNPAAQKAQLISMLDQLKASGVNAVMFQIRTECDALYKSKYDPWSYWLTGTSGKAPSPYYDPLQFAIEEAHKRGIELHAWLNPYRAKHASSNYSYDSTHVTKRHPDWILSFGSGKILDPGLPQVRNYVTNVIMDVVHNYDVDGIHFDDYFYMSEINTSTYSNADANTFKNYSRGFTNIQNWRRDNVNLLIAQINDSIKVTKPFVKFGISPSGIWKSGYPSGVCGMSAYSDLYADGIAWLQKKIIDYINPQLYWAIGSKSSCGSTDFERLMKWWADSAYANGRHLYTGHATYRISSFTATEMPNEIRLNRAYWPKCQGSVHYNTSALLGNPKGFMDSLKTNLYRYPAFPPLMAWKESTPPNAPKNVRFDRLPTGGVSVLKWDTPDKASDGDVPIRYAIYRFNKANITASDLEDATKLVAVTGELQYTPQASTDGNFYVVTALDRNSNESKPSQVVTIEKPTVPVIVSPSNNAENQRDTVKLSWRYASQASSYDLQVSTDAAFGSFFVNQTNVKDTFYVVTGMNGMQKYYWRLRAVNSAGTSEFSAVFNFTTGFPGLSYLVDPPHATTSVPEKPTLKWRKIQGADSYRLMVGTSRPILPETIVIDTLGIKDTSYTFTKYLALNKAHYWQVRGVNENGQGKWSEAWGFRTVTTGVEEQLGTVIPASTALMQNYPNPFNPSTVIEYHLASAGDVSLKVYDLLGREIATLAEGYRKAGIYTVEFDAASYGISSGIYIYRIQAGSFSESRKLIMVK